MKVVKSTILIISFFILNVSICYSKEKINNDGLKFTHIESIVIYIHPSTGWYSIRGDIYDQINQLRKSAGIKVLIGSVVQILEMEQNLQLDKFKPVRNYKKFIKNYETYVVFEIKSKKGIIELIYDGNYLINVTEKTRRKVADSYLLNFDPLKSH